MFFQKKNKSSHFDDIPLLEGLDPKIYKQMALKPLETQLSTFHKVYLNYTSYRLNIISDNTRLSAVRRETGDDKHFRAA